MGYTAFSVSAQMEKFRAKGCLVLCMRVCTDIESVWARKSDRIKRFVES